MKAEGGISIANKRVLVIKHGALGDIVLAIGPFLAIRKAHKGDHLALLTASSFAAFLEPSGIFDSILIDDRPRSWHLVAWARLLQTLRVHRFDRVYDLQHSTRTGLIYRVLSTGRRLEWSGIASGCSHPHRNPQRDHMHTIERQAGQLADAGIAVTPAADLSWVRADISRFALRDRYALLVPGGAPHRPAKRWPVQNFIALASWLSAQGCTPVLLGGKSESSILPAIAEAVPAARNLLGQTSLEEIVALARGAAIAIGNDTGPMHMVAASNCPCVVLFSADSNPVLTAPRGASIEILQMNSLAELGVDKIVAAARRTFDAAASAYSREQADTKTST